MKFPAYEGCITTCQAGELAGYHCAGLVSRLKNGPDANYMVKLFIECARQCKLTAQLAAITSKHLRQVAEYCQVACQSCHDICLRASEPELQQQAPAFEQAMHECLMVAKFCSYKC